VGDGERIGPLVLAAGERDGGLAVEVETLADARAAGAERGVFRFREDGEPAVDDRVREAARDVFDAVGLGVGYARVWREGDEAELGVRRLEYGVVEHACAGEVFYAVEIGRGPRGRARL